MRRGVVSFLFLAAAVFLAGPASAGALTKCRLSYDVKGWSVIYKTSKGTGQVTCENGQSASVRISTHGGGATIGTTEVIGGKGAFSGVRDIEEVYGTYVEATAHAGAGASTDARAMTKGDVSLSLVGTGRGLNLGVAVGGFTISPR
jgi:hypothetical protein